MRDTQSRFRANDILRCPNCGSRHTQSLSTAYAYSARQFRKTGNVEALPESQEPPERKSEVIVPSLLGAATFSIIHLATLVMSTKEGWEWTSFLDLFHWQLVAPAGAIGAAVAIALVIRAWKWNLRELPKLLHKWHGTAVCRRCSAQFQIPRGAASKPRRQS